jgi:hypothetical protein
MINAFFFRFLNVYTVIENIFGHTFLEKNSFLVDTFIASDCDQQFKIRARICKRLRSIGIDSKQSIPPGWESIPGLLKKFTKWESDWNKKKMAKLGLSVVNFRRSPERCGRNLSYLATLRYNLHMYMHHLNHLMVVRKHYKKISVFYNNYTPQWFQRKTSPRSRKIRNHRLKMLSSKKINLEWDFAAGVYLS